jgi:cyclopropane fatty-acyl-phospholipid synthase-like methyltransferase
LVHSQGLIEHFQGKDFKRLINNHLKFVKKGGYLLLFYPTRQGLYPVIRWLAELVGKWIFTDEVPLRKDKVMKVIGRKADLVASTLAVPYSLTEEGILLRKIDL